MDRREVPGPVGRRCVRNIFKKDYLAEGENNDIMSEVRPGEGKPKCTICESFNLKGTWTCECDAINISRDTKCWRCGRPRFEDR